MRDLSGEGIAMAYRAGADIGNMEFITFCCNVLLHPPVWRGSIATYMLHTILGGQLTNANGESFLDTYDPYTVEKGTRMEWNKSFLSFATAKEVRAGNGTPHGGIYYSRGQAPWEPFEAMAGFLFPNWKYKALDLSELGRKIKDGERVEVGHAVEYFDGGIVVNERFETSVAGLYAAGECTLGPFGANRVAAAITEMLVHGAAAGNNAAEYARKTAPPQADASALKLKEETALLPLTHEQGEHTAPVRRRVQETAHKCLGPLRNEEELQSFIECLEDVKKNELPHLATSSKSRAYNKEWIDALELENMVQLLEASARSALHRTESRGGHYREDHPHTDNDNWLQESVVALTDEGMDVRTRPVTFTTIAPPKGVTPYLDMMKEMMEAHSDVGGHH
jgi:succinate dehydrogenase/fumarate reductase flavoprotein subunit